jgi:uncharacterized coiled-coil protein SlyX
LKPINGEKHMTELAKRLTTWGGLLQAAETTKPPPIYRFEDDDDINHNVVPIPISLDQRRDVLVSMLNQVVEIQGDQARLAEELANLTKEIRRHHEAMADELLKINMKCEIPGEPT